MSLVKGVVTGRAGSSGSSGRFDAVALVRSSRRSGRMGDTAAAGRMEAALPRLPESRRATPKALPPSPPSGVPQPAASLQAGYTWSILVSTQSYLPLMTGALQ